MADKKPKQKYRALIGMNYPPDRRVEIGEIVDDIPVMSLGWLLDQGKIELVSDEGAATERLQEALDDNLGQGKEASS